MGRDPTAARLQEVDSREATEPEARTATSQGAQAAAKVRAILALKETGRVSLPSSTHQAHGSHPGAELIARKDRLRPQCRRDGARPVRHSEDRKMGHGQEATLEKCAREKSLVRSTRLSTAGCVRRGQSQEGLRVPVNLLDSS